MIFFLMLTSILMASKSNNPVKTSMAVLVTSISMFTYMGVVTGSTWVPILMTMLFMGGIIMMFMILSSVLPNEKSMKIKNFAVLAFPLVLAMMSWKWVQESIVSSEKYQSFLASGSNFWTMMALIMGYFLISMSFLSTEETPMRSVYCYKSLIL